MATTNTPQEPTIEALRVPEERRKSSTEMLNIMVSNFDIFITPIHFFFGGFVVAKFP